MAIKREIEITLERIFLGKKTVSGSKSNHILDFKLLYPRPTVAQKAAQKAVKLEKGLWDGEGRPWTGRILFKETIQGRTGIEISISEALGNSEIDAIIRASSSTLIKTMTSLAADALGAGLASTVLSVPMNVLAKSVDKKSDVSVIARAIADLPDGLFSSLKAGTPVLMEFPLCAAKDIPGEYTKTTKGSPAARRVLAHEGEEIGKVHLKIEAI